MTSKEALETVKDYLLPKLKEDNSELGSIIIVESVNVLEKLVERDTPKKVEKQEKLLELYKRLNNLYEKLYTMELSELSLNSNYYEIEIIKLKQQIKELENDE